MKKKLFLGLSIVLVIFAAGAFIVDRNLDTMVQNQRLINEQDVIIGKYNDMLFRIKAAQAELYRHQAGYTRNIDDLVNNIEAFDEDRESLAKGYSGHLNDVACMQCHAKIEERLASVSGIFAAMQGLLKTFKEDVSILITTNDESQIRLLENEAARKGGAITDLLEKARHGADKMRTEIKNQRNALIDRSQVAIVITVALTFALSFAVFVLVMRGITVPIDSLIKGIQTIARGDFTKRVDVAARDEIGFMAAAFNDMAGRLSAMNEEKDRLLQTLQGFNQALEEKVKEATEKLRTTQESMVRAETLAAVGTLAAGVSHEISTPLNTIIGFAQLSIAALGDGDSLKGDLRVIEQEALRCKRIVQGLLDFSRTAGHEARPIDLNSVINDTLSLIEYQPSMRRIAVKRELEAGLPVVQADPMQLRQVFLNLILNAVQAMPEGGELKVTTRGGADTVEAAVSDSGIGIPAEALKKIFQPFYTTKQDGTGLGLSISYGIVREHGGDILVESAPAKGTVFRIMLPMQRGRGETQPAGQRESERQ